MSKTRDVPESFRHLPGRKPEGASHTGAARGESKSERLPLAGFLASASGLAVILLAAWFTGNFGSALFHAAGGVVGLIAAFTGGRVAVDLGREARARKDPDETDHAVWRTTDREFERMRRPY